ncbi:hypothetical protein [Paraburkholderia hospita]|uniref:hypothetical protein n=1 Tax=Paraburkholderia hospita TaxID=169430 RepID=UPI001F61CEE7|nr:hypothetical protein [Paraburkholderia hospita]
MADTTSSSSPTSMKKWPTSKPTLLIALSMLSVPTASHAHALDSQLDCRSSSHEFIAALLSNHEIDPNPIRVERNSVNAFRPTPGARLTAFGFRVHTVLGYHRDDIQFKQGSGEPISDSAYGVVVIGSAEAVEARVRDARSNALVHQVVPLILTVIFCQ